MSFIESSLKLRERVFSRARLRARQEEDQAAAKVSRGERTLQFDLFAQLSYMATLATADVSRSELFRRSAQLPYSSSKYFRQVYLLADRLNLDYSRACRMVGEKTKNAMVKSLLLRMSGALASGEGEGQFLRREAEVIGEAYGNQYDRDVESLKKWTDAYVALVVAAALIVIVSIISMMIYEVGTIFVMGLAFAMVMITAFGAWVIYVSAPREVKTRLTGPSSPLQRRAHGLARVLLPLAALSGALILALGRGLDLALVASALFILPVGLIAYIDDRQVDRRDADIATFVRVLGGVTSAIGTTVAEALGKVDRRSLGSLMADATKLRYRLVAGISPEVCWKRFVDDSGSELVERTVKMFYDALSLGGEADRIGSAASFFASKIAFLRANRGLVASTFQWLALPLHIALVALMEFIVEVIALFSESINKSSEALAEATQGGPRSSLAIADLFAFGSIDMDIVRMMVTTVLLVITVSNAFAVRAAEGGHTFKFLFNLAVAMIITGLLMLAVPGIARSIFQSVVEV